jgi:hypothetical protein
MTRRARACGLSLPVIRRADMLHGLLSAGRGVTSVYQKMPGSLPRRRRPQFDEERRLLVSIWRDRRHRL